MTGPIRSSSGDRALRLDRRHGGTAGSAPAEGSRIRQALSGPPAGGLPADRSRSCPVACRLPARGGRTTAGGAGAGRRRRRCAGVRRCWRPWVRRGPRPTAAPAPAAAASAATAERLASTGAHAVAASATRTEDDAPLEVEIDSLAPSYVPEKGPVSISGTVTNRTDETFTGDQRPRLHRRRPDHLGRRARRRAQARPRRLRRRTDHRARQLRHRRRPGARAVDALPARGHAQPARGRASRVSTGSASTPSATPTSRATRSRTVAPAPSSRWCRARTWTRCRPRWSSRCGT